MGGGNGTGRHVVETDRSSVMGLAGNGIHRSRQGPMSRHGKHCRGRIYMRTGASCQWSGAGHAQPAPTQCNVNLERITREV